MEYGIIHIRNCDEQLCPLKTTK